MSNKTTSITLDCGITATRWLNDAKASNGKKWVKTGKQEEWLEIDINRLYDGGDKSPDFLLKMSLLFKELYEKGFQNDGIAVDHDYYCEVIDGMNLRVMKIL